MENSLCKKNFFEVFLEERIIPDPDILLGKAFKFLMNLGRNVSVIGFDETSAPIVNIDEELYVFDKYFGIWEHARFTKTDKSAPMNSLSERKIKIESYL